MYKAPNAPVYQALFAPNTVAAAKKDSDLFVGGCCSSANDFGVYE